MEFKLYEISIRLPCDRLTPRGKVALKWDSASRIFLTNVVRKLKDKHACKWFYLIYTFINGTLTSDFINFFRYYFNDYKISPLLRQFHQQKIICLSYQYGNKKYFSEIKSNPNRRNLSFTIFIICTLQVLSKYNFSYKKIIFVSFVHVNKSFFHGLSSLWKANFAHVLRKWVVLSVMGIRSIRRSVS